MTYQDNLRGTPGAAVRMLEAPLQLQELPADAEHQDPQLLLSAVQDMAIAQATLAELVAQQDFKIVEATLAELASRLEDVTQMEAANAQMAVVVEQTYERLNIAEGDLPVMVPPPVDAHAIPQTEIDEIAARLGELVDQNSEGLGGAELQVSAASSRVGEAASNLLAAHNDGKADDWMFYILGAWLLSQFVPRCHVHFHWNTAQAGIASVKALAAGTTTTGLAASTTTGLLATSAGGGTAVSTSASASAGGAMVAGGTAVEATSGGVAAAGGGAVAAESAGTGALAFGLTAASIAAVLAISVTTIVWWVEGWTSSCSLSEGTGHGTCPADEAEVVVISEEGIGNCLWYFYGSQSEAEEHAGSWRITSRILFSGVRGQALQEQARWGPAMPYNTIRSAAKMLEEKIQ